jgi:hypothetical protein
MKIDIIWNKEEVELDKRSDRPGNNLYLDSVLWGVAINNMCNPTLLVLLMEINKELNQKKTKKGIKHEYK